MAGTWKTAGGSEIRIRDMRDDHLQNVLRMLRRRAEALRWGAMREADRMLDFLNGEGAIDCVESEMARMADLQGDDLLEMIVPEWFDLIGEARRRGLPEGMAEQEDGDAV